VLTAARHVRDCGLHEIQRPKHVDGEAFKNIFFRTSESRIKFTPSCIVHFAEAESVGMSVV